MGECILSLVHPDCDVIDALEAVQTSVRLLFSREPSVREEGISRILYILTCWRRSPEFLPDISQITNAIPNDVVILDYQADVAARFRENDAYNGDSIEKLLGILDIPNGEASVRKSALMQLNLLAMDPRVNDFLANGQGWVAVLRVLDTCFKVNQMEDYVDICIPAIGIFTKLLLHSQDLRMQLADEINVYFILFRGLFMYHLDGNLKADVATALFLLVTPYAFGSYAISLPVLMHKLHVPFAQENYWSTSPYAYLSEINEIFCENLPSSRHTTPKSTNLLATSWQYLRMSFGHLWFNGLANVIVNARNAKRDGENCERLNYAHIPVGKEIKMIEPLNFSDAMRMTKKDLLLIHASLPMDSMKYFMHQIENATTHAEVTNAIEHIHCNLALHHKMAFPMETLVGIMKKFCISPPTNEDDCDLFLKTIHLLRITLDHDDNGKVLEWLMGQINGKTSVFISILKDPKSSVITLRETAKLLNKVNAYFFH